MSRPLSDPTVPATGALTEALTGAGGTRTAAKGALPAFARTAAEEPGPPGARAAMVSGGLRRAADASAATPEAVFGMVAAQSPPGRVTTPAEMADAAPSFAGPRTRAVTGRRLIPDGGPVCG